MTDNFKLIKQYLIDNGIPQHNASNLMKHYVVEIISRGKDNPDMPIRTQVENLLRTIRSL